MKKSIPTSRHRYVNGPWINEHVHKTKVICCKAKLNLFHLHFSERFTRLGVGTKQHVVKLRCFSTIKARAESLGETETQYLEYLNPPWGPKKLLHTLPETNSSPMKIPIFPGKYRENGGFSMAMLVYRRVDLAKWFIIFHQPRFPWNFPGSHFPKPNRYQNWGPSVVWGRYNAKIAIFNPGLWSSALWFLGFQEWEPLGTYKHHMAGFFGGRKSL